MIRRRLLLLALWAVCCSAVAASPQISLLTFQPGELYWQRYGHNALRVVEGGQERVYNYGVFDFQQKNFALNFARGRMLYRLATEPTAHTLALYAAEGRWIHEQVLDFSPGQARTVSRFLARNALPQYAEYRYDYFTANCSTRLRDVIDLGTGGALARQLQQRPTTVTYRSEAARMMAPLPPMMWLTDAMLGVAADQPLTLWQHSFLPEVLMQAVRAARFDDGRPLVREERRLFQGHLAPPSAESPRLTGPFAAAGGLLALAVIVLMTLAARARARSATRRLGGAGIGLVWGVNGLGGLFLLLGWVATDHAVMADNANLWVFTPLSLIWAVTWMVPRARRSAGGVRLLRLGSLLNVLLGGVALSLQLLPGAQAHLHWVVFWLPVHGVLAAGLPMILRSEAARR